MTPRMPTRLRTIPTSTRPMRAPVLDVMPTLVAASRKPTNVMMRPTNPLPVLLRAPPGDGRDLCRLESKHVQRGTSEPPPAACPQTCAILQGGRQTRANGDAQIPELLGGLKERRHSAR